MEGPLSPISPCQDGGHEEEWEPRNPGLPRPRDHQQPQELARSSAGSEQRWGMTRSSGKWLYFPQEPRLGVGPRGDLCLPLVTAYGNVFTGEFEERVPRAHRVLVSCCLAF